MYPFLLLFFETSFSGVEKPFVKRTSTGVCSVIVEIVPEFRPERSDPSSVRFRSFVCVCDAELVGSLV